jgi:hypothetical protein
MKKNLFLSLLLTAATVLIPAFVLAGCGDLTETGLTVTSLSESTTTNPVFSSIPGETTSTASLSATTTVTSRRPVPIATTTTLRSFTLETTVLTDNRYQETDPHLVWTGLRGDAVGDIFSGGFSRFFYSAGSAVTIKFTGTYIVWVGTMGDGFGIATVSLDGVQETVDTYGDGTTHYQAKIWGSGTLAYGSHKVKITCTGTANPSSSDNMINVDAFDITGTIE